MTHRKIREARNAAIRSRLNVEHVLPYANCHPTIAWVLMFRRAGARRSDIDWKIVRDHYDHANQLQERAMLSKAGPRADEITTCKKCGASIMFLRTAAGKQMPVNVMPTDKKFRGPNSGENLYVHGAHQPHWGTCPEADSFRGRHDVR